MSGTTRKSAPAHSYLSLVGGVVMRHHTWAECERRVKGVAGAKFRKTHSAEDEGSVIRAWGLPAGALDR
jgi:ribonuclease HI